MLLKKWSGQEKKEEKISLAFSLFILPSYLSFLRKSFMEWNEENRLADYSLKSVCAFSPFLWRRYVLHWSSILFKEVGKSWLDWTTGGYSVSYIYLQINSLHWHTVRTYLTYLLTSTWLSWWAFHHSTLLCPKRYII